MRNYIWTPAEWRDVPNFFLCRSADEINCMDIYSDKLTSILISVITALQSNYCHIYCNVVVSLQTFLFKSTWHSCPCPTSSGYSKFCLEHCKEGRFWKTVRVLCICTYAELLNEVWLCLNNVRYLCIWRDSEATVASLFKRETNRCSLAKILDLGFHIPNDDSVILQCTVEMFSDTWSSITMHLWSHNKKYRD